MSLRKRPDGSYVIRYYADGTKRGIQRQETLHGVTYAEAHRIYSTGCPPRPHGAGPTITA